MAEQQVAFLYSAATSLQGNSTTMQLLKSYYMIRCKTICSKERDLPEKQFGPSKRCSHCGLEWKHGGYGARVLMKVAASQVLPARKLKKGARRKLRQSVKKTENTNKASSKMNTTLSNTLEKLCQFCCHKTLIRTLKPSSKKKLLDSTLEKNLQPNHKAVKIKVAESHKYSGEESNKLKNEVNIYCNSKSIFTSNFNKTVELAGVKIQKKVPKKSKKDKFAGLCKKAVLASAKGKQNPDTTDSKLGLFLKKTV